MAFKRSAEAGIWSTTRCRLRQRMIIIHVILLSGLLTSNIYAVDQSAGKAFGRSTVDSESLAEGHATLHTQQYIREALEAGLISRSDLSEIYALNLKVEHFRDRLLESITDEELQILLYRRTGVADVFWVENWDEEEENPYQYLIDFLSIMAEFFDYLAEQDRRAGYAGEKNDQEAHKFKELIEKARNYKNASEDDIVTLDALQATYQAKGFTVEDLEQDIAIQKRLYRHQ